VCRCKRGQELRLKTLKNKPTTPTYNVIINILISFEITSIIYNEKKYDADWQSLVEKYKPSRVFDFDNVQRSFSSPFWRFVHFTINDNREAEMK
jgi:hypothetical protein